MTTRNLMRLSAFFMGALGLCATFLPQEILVYMGLPPSGLPALAVQVGGALYLGFAILNWMAQAHLIGGIYSRPVALGNLCHFLVAALALLKGALAGPHQMAIVVGAVVYALLAALFALVVFRHPVPQTPSS